MNLNTYIELSTVSLPLEKKGVEEGPGVALGPGGSRRWELWTLPSAGDKQESHHKTQTSVGKKLPGEANPSLCPAVSLPGGCQ